MSEIYPPAEDSYLMFETLKKEIPILIEKNPDLKFIEVGCGSGVNIKAAKKAGIKIDNIIGCDINNESINHCRNLGFKVILSDLFKNIKGKFDLIIFNPPYLPLDKNEPKSSRIATTGGRKGNEIIIKFLKQARNFLTRGGKIFLITSSLSPNINFNKLGYKAREIANKKMFFEKLSLWECLKI